MTDSNRSVTAALDRKAILSWDLIPDERAPSKAIIMRFANYEAGHAALTAVGFSPTGDPVQAPKDHDARTAVKYTHPDGSTVVLAQPLAAPHVQERLGLGAVGG